MGTPISNKDFYNIAKEGLDMAYDPYVAAKVDQMKKLYEMELLKQQHLHEMEMEKTAIKKQPEVPELYKIIMQIQKDHIQTQAQLIEAQTEEIKRLKGVAHG